VKKTANGAESTLIENTISCPLLVKEKATEGATKQTKLPDVQLLNKQN